MDCDEASGCVCGSRNALSTAALAVFLLCISGPMVFAQAGYGSVEGRVTCDDGGFPARNAKVDFIQLSLLFGEAYGPKVVVRPDSYTAVTDFDGYYSIHTLVPGEYLVLGNLSGYSVDFALIFAHLKEFTPERQKELLAPFTHVTVRAGALAHQDVVIRRGAAISGRVSFDSGGSLHDTAVRAMMISTSVLGDRLTAAEKPVNVSDATGPTMGYMTGTTNDLGDYRIAGLSAGQYRVYVVINHHGSANPAGPVTVWAPESISAENSRLIEVAEGDEISDADISIPLRRLHSIGGTVTRGGTPVEKGSLTIQRQDAAGESDVPIQPDGSFRIDLVPAGTYIIGAQDFYSKKEKQVSAGNKTITIQLGDHDILDANLELLGGRSGD